jgi:hypothetical protein
VTTVAHILLIGAISIGSAVASVALVTVVLVRLPKDYFVDPESRTLHTHHPVVRIVLTILKNMLGLVLVVAGIILSIPGVPGQGFLTIFLGIMLLDFPGKYRLERAILQRPSILGAINRIRAKFRKEPLEVYDA